MVQDKIKIIGISVSLAWISVLVLAIFLKAVGVLFNPFFDQHAKVIAIVSGILVGVLVIIGAISISSIKKKASVS